VSEETVYVAIPTHGRDIDAGVMMASHNMGEVRVHLTWSASSLLAANFNKCLCEAKNRKMDWLLIWHGDIAPSGRAWLRGMVDAAESVRADLFSAVSPLKGPHGFTSTAGDTTDGMRRITMREMEKLPDVFNVDDVRTNLWPCRWLLVNTGLMLVRLANVNPATTHFTIRDLVTERGGVYRWSVMPEDWGFSGAAGRRGLRVYGSKKPELVHVGAQEYPNSGEPWGLETDPAPMKWGGE
jgi:hypothetical protein